MTQSRPQVQWHAEGLSDLTAPGYLGEEPQTLADLYGVGAAGSTAMIDGDGAAVSYLQLRDLALRISGSLIALGVEPGGRVAILMENRAEWLAAFIGATSIGAVAVPLSTFSTASELADDLASAGAEILLMVAGFASHDYVRAIDETLGADATVDTAIVNLPEIRANRYPLLRRIVVLNIAEREWATAWPTFVEAGRDLPGNAIRHRAERLSPGMPAALLFTSGSTGRRKAAILPHWALASNAFHTARRQGLTCSDIIWSHFPFFFSGGAVNFALGGMSAGAALMIDARLDAGRALEAMTEHGATGWHIQRHAFNALSAHPAWGDFLGDARLPRKGSVPFDPFPEMPKPFCDDWVDMYGLTETSVAVAISTHAAGVPGRPGANQGVPLPGLQVRVCDSNGHAVPIGATGEIRLQGRSLMLGYYGYDAGVTFDEEGFFPTGDFGCLTPTGCLKYLGRLKDTIKVRSMAVTPGEIESCLATFPGIEEAVVFGVDSDANGESPVALIEVARGVDVDPGNLRTHLSQRLSSYKVPIAIAVVGSGSVPRTGTGKPARIKARELFQELRPSSDQIPSSSACEIWEFRDA